MQLQNSVAPGFAARARARARGRAKAKAALGALGNVHLKAAAAVGPCAVAAQGDCAVAVLVAAVEGGLDAVRERGLVARAHVAAHFVRRRGVALALGMVEAGLLVLLAVRPRVMPEVHGQRGLVGFLRARPRRRVRKLASWALRAECCTSS